MCGQIEERGSNNGHALLNVINAIKSRGGHCFKVIGLLEGVFFSLTVQQQTVRAICFNLCSKPIGCRFERERKRYLSHSCVGYN